MRKLLAIALLTALVVITWAVLQPTEGQLAAQETGRRLYQSHLGDRPVPTPAVAQAPRQEVTAEPVTYGTVAGEEITGYLARPANATEPLPGLIVIHEWWGLNENIEMMTQRLAGEGYAALAVDLFGQTADTPEAARSQVQAATQNPALLQENLRQAYRYLVETEAAPTIGSIGWCFGGSWSLQTALLFPDTLDAAVIYYGGNLVTDPTELEPLSMPILGIFGGIDDNPPVETVREFESVLNDLDKSVEIYIYEGADHAFANPSGTRYNAAAAADAWEKTIAFLNEHLKG
ncbi:MAG: dienelactone hydrolase family protein [Synechococcales bacterium]|nr:dienelactone hydrolase family protein [Synechococcales bacterium]